MARLAPTLFACAVLALVAGCGGDDTKTVTETQTQGGTTAASETTSTAEGSGTQAQAASAGTVTSVPAPSGNHGPHYFESPTNNIGCYVDSHSARCDIRRRVWSPPPEPASCRKIGLDFGQGIAVGPHRAEFVCAGDTTLGGPVILPYGASTERGDLICVSRAIGMTCRNTGNGHGFYLSRQSYRLF